MSCPVSWAHGTMQLRPGLLGALGCQGLRVCKRAGTWTVAKFQPDFIFACTEVLPDEMIMMVIARLSPYAWGHVACVCRQWRALCEVQGVTDE